MPPEDLQQEISHVPKIIRCPYCVERGQFMPMAERSGGDWSLCDSCGHLVVPQNPAFKCTCAHCVQIEKAPKLRSGLGRR
jgi:hypothetical protein